ncbi:ATPase, T2SS/T4P/T4SS family [Trichlorobacter ammonificans]|uniref:Type II secretory pathway ATPase GspE/PulE or T4P pilus assembly pathway ATPase PilB n=1 Tax=Trichlorobacter ammonificans TaxID=2916410 RepID=A0ABM9D8W7_9BACT|nr:ATPase, T2SS/T4P/T4SS family [Trichlorobacter ammonificans]CAH2031572.1 Type II secretory pathway ATPase GspE/PulE or T4P pilus assembly pathway ATPase PilB [Trichlorobacter ammonificans]
MSRYAHLFRTAGTDVGTAAESVDTDADNPTPEQFCLLFVDDEPGVLSALKRIFLEENYSILTADSGAKALQLLAQQPVHLVICDHRMPGMTGAELLKLIREQYPQTIRIMLTGYADVNSIMGAVKDGAVYKFITKPWNDEDLRLTVSLALQQYVLMHENRRLKELAKQQQNKLSNYAGLFDENRGRLGEILVNSGLVGREELALAVGSQEAGEFLGVTLVRLGLVTEPHLLAALQKALGIDLLDLRELTIPQNVARCLPREICEKSHLLPVRLEGSLLTIAMADPSDILKCDNIARVTGLRVTAVLAPAGQISQRLQQAWEQQDGLEEMSGLEPMDEIDIVLEEEEKEVSVEELIGSSKVPPVIRIVNAIISEAIRYGASDIHIEAKTKYSLIRYRIDGMLHAKIRIPSDLHAAVISRIKILAKMDIAERRRPQDGRITVKSGTRIVDMRVSSLPTLNGEKIVMRILDKSAAIRRLEELGVLPEDMKQIELVARKPQGVIIATGPTGSGKTTLLYSLLSAMMNPSKNFETIEEPVEYFLEEANQVSIHEKIGLTFAQVLRSTLRQDPDVILVGEMRDFETADVAFKAALTGHMVLSTLHTNSAIASITRLIDMGIKPFILASALEGIVAQRLVRRICPDCRQTTAPDPQQCELLRVPAGFFDNGVARGAGCSRCNNTGYKGRLGVYEIFVMNDDYRQMIGTNYRESELLTLARGNGMRTLLEDGLEKVRRGMTTLDELLRVLGPAVRIERSCPSCGFMMDSRFLFCPQCGTFRSDLCRSCHLPLEKGWHTCPYCGTGREK